MEILLSKESRTCDCQQKPAKYEAKVKAARRCFQFLNSNNHQHRKYTCNYTVCTHKNAWCLIVYNWYHKTKSIIIIFSCGSYLFNRKFRIISYYSLPISRTSWLTLFSKWKPGLVNGILIHGREVGKRWAFRSLPTQTSPQFYENYSFS